MANIRVCDRCGEEIAYEPTNEVTFDACKCTVMYNAGHTYTTSYDLCKKCKEKLNAFLKNADKVDAEENDHAT